MKEYLGSVEIIAIHDRLIKEYKGADGIRDLGMIESAVNRPKNGYYIDLIQEAAALWESLSQNHPFVDGNKRVAFAATDVFLRANGINITATPEDAYDFVMSLHESNRFQFIELDAWLRLNSKSTEQD